MRTCTSCRVEQPETEFHVRNPRKGTLHTQCKTCIRAYAKKWANINKEHKKEYAQKYYKDSPRAKVARQKEWGTKWNGVREWLMALKGQNPCADCNKIYHYAIMDLDHVYGEKCFNIASVMGAAISDDVLLEEIQKCELVCSNCHRIRTWKRNNP